MREDWGGGEEGKVASRYNKYGCHHPPPSPLSILHSITATALTLSTQICNKVVLLIGQWDGVIRG